MKWMLIVTLVATSAIPAMPAQAQQRVLTIFGEDKCPSDTICVVAPESERYRIPKPFRQSAPTPRSQSWATRSQSIVSEGNKAGGIGSCSSTGAGGWTGCWAEQMRKAREEAKAKAEGQTLP